MRSLFCLAILMSAPAAFAQDFFSKDKAVVPPKEEPQSRDRMVRTPPPASLPDSFSDPMVRAPSSDMVDPRFEQGDEWEHDGDGSGPGDGRGHGRGHGEGRHRERRRAMVSVNLSIQGGAFGRARAEYEKIGAVLGPAQAPSRFGGMFALQLAVDIKRNFRIGGDFTFTHTRAFGVGPDAGGIEIRQSVNYQTYTGGVLLEAIAPVRDILEFSFGSTVGGGSLRADANSSRVDSFYDLGTNLRAIALTDRLSVNAPVLHIKPAVGVRARFTRHSVAAFDVRIGANILWVPRGTMRMWDDLIVYGSPHIIELQPFITAGIAFGSWGRG